MVYIVNILQLFFGVVLGISSNLYISYRGSGVVVPFTTDVRKVGKLESMQ